MKALSKPLSSPGRTDKFPPPLMMRFLRSNVGSRSRGRSRSSPMFYLRTRKSLPGPAETHQEPSSPKVTCIGQVRVRRSSKSTAKKPGCAAVNRHRRRCRWLKKTLFCGKKSLNFSSHKRPFLRVFNKWGSFFRSGYCKKVDDATEDSLRAHHKIEKNENNVVSGYNNNSSNNNRISSSSTSESDYSSNKYENLGGGSLECRRNFLEASSSNSSPPKNALLLTRCRSAPYRSSSLGGIFWGSSAFTRENGEDNNEAENEGKTEENVVEIEPIIFRKSSEKSEKSGEDLKAIVENGGVHHPLLLTRCKSEPAKTGERLNQESIFLRQLRLDVVDPISQQNS